MHRATKFDQRAWLEEYIDINKEVQKYAKISVLEKSWKMYENTNYR